MTRSHLSSRRNFRTGFTLVELLVVIAIIAILAGVILSAGTNALKAARRLKAGNTATQIQTACLAYYTEYSVYPVPAGSTSATALISDSGATAGASWAVLDCVLSGNIHPSDGTGFTPSGTNPTNTRNISFLSFKTADVFTATDAAANVNAIQDAPKNPMPSSTSANLFFNIAMDADYANVLGVAPSTCTTLPNFSATTWNTAAQNGGGTSTAGVAVWANCNASTTVNQPQYWVHTY